MPIVQHIFRKYDIRGIMDKEIDFAFVRMLGYVLANYFKENGHQRVLIGYDTRKNSKEYHDILCEELNRNHCDVMSLGMIPSPCLYFAVHHLQVFAGIMVTASHNDAPYNGFKIWQGEGTLCGQSIQELYQRMLNASQGLDENVFLVHGGKTENSNQVQFVQERNAKAEEKSLSIKEQSLDTKEKSLGVKKETLCTQEKILSSQVEILSIKGISSYFDIKNPYIKILCEQIGHLSCKVVVDGSNASAGELCCHILREMGADVIPLYCEPSSDFPNHPPDPTIVEHCKDLCNQIIQHKADYGIGLDGDGDRVVMVDREGRILACDELLGLLAKDTLLRIPNACILADVKCTQQIFKEIEALGGRGIMAPTGHSPMKIAMREEKAHLGGELSGHFFHAENWFGTDDGILTAVRVLGILRDRKWDLTQFPLWKKSHITPEIRFDCPENIKYALIKKSQEYYTKKYGECFKVNCIDGVRVDFTNSWFLIRASHTSAALTLRFEAETEEALTLLKNKKIKKLTEWLYENL